MTATDQNEAAKEAARELERRLRRVAALRDPYAAGMDFMQWLRDHHWRCMPPDPKLTRATADAGTGTPPAEVAVDLEEARRRCETASSKIHSKETP